MADDICGYETASGSPCQHPATADGDPDRCWIPAHGGTQGNHGRPAAFNDGQTRQRALLAVSSGLKVKHQASLAGVSPDTLRRALCCVETPRDPVLSSNPCDFCESYAQAHANGAREVLDDCRPEFTASAAYGYTATEERKHTGDEDNAIVFNVKE